MRFYRKMVGWTVRVIALPFLVAYLLALFVTEMAGALLQASLRWTLEFAALVETWETAEAAPEWRPLKESVLEQRETDWTVAKPEDERLDT